MYVAVDKREFLFRRLMTVLLLYCFSQSEKVDSCISTINCTGKIMTTSLSSAFAEAEAYTYICSKDVRPSKKL